MTTFLRLLPFAGVILLSFACGGGSSTYEEADNRTADGVRTIDIEGSVDNATSPTKPRWASGNSLIHTGAIFDLNNSQQWTMVIDDSENYSSTIVRRSDIALEVYRDNALVLSRVMSEDETLINTQAKVNTITHLHASMARRLKADQGGELSFHLETINQALFGKTSINESEFTLDNLSEDLTNVKAIVATYGELFRAPTAAGFSSLLAKLNGTLNNSSTSVIVAEWLNTINSITSQDEANAYASAHEGAKNSGISGANLLFNGLSNSFNSGLLLNAIDEAKASPVFGSNVDSARTATPGALLTYTFPSATTQDILGISSYSGQWLGDAPTGTWRNTANEGRTLQFLPNAADVGKSFSFLLTAKGGNGKSTSASNLTFTVKTPTLTPMPRKALSYRPLIGPVVDNTYLYLVSSSDSGHQLYMEKILLDAIQTSSGEDSILGSQTWVLPSSISEVTDLHLHLNTLYISSDEGAYGFDASFLGQLPNSIAPSHSNSELNSMFQAVIGNEIIHYYPSGNVQKTNLSLSDNSILTLPTAFLSAMGNTFVLSGNSSIYEYDQNLLIASFQTEHRAYFFNTSGELEYLNSFSPGTLRPTPDSVPTIALPRAYVQSSDNMLARFLPGTESVDELPLNRPELIESLNPHGVSGNFLFDFKTDATTGTNQVPTYTLHGNSLSGNSLSIIEISDLTLNDLHFGNNPEDLSMKIQSTETGVQTGKSGTWIYSIGNDGIGSDNWFIQAHLLEPED